MIVGDKNVVRVADLERDGVLALARFLLGLQRQKLPVSDAIEADLGSHMVFDRRLVHAPWCLGVGDIDAGIGVGAGAPEVGERAAAAVRHPQTRVLACPALGGVGVGRSVGVVGVEPRSVVEVGAVAALELDVIDHRVGARSPQQRCGARIDPAGVETQTRDDVVALGARLHQGLGRANALIAWSAVRQHDLGQVGVQTDQHRVRPQSQGLGDHIEPRRKIEDTMAVDGALEGGGVVGEVVALGAERADIGPLRHGGQSPDRRSGRPGRRDGLRLHLRLGRAHLAQARQGQAMVEGHHPIGRTLARHGLAAVAKANERGSLDRRRALEPDLGVDAGFVGNDDPGPGDVLEPDVLAP